MSRNPFAVLGITPEILRGLTKEQSAQLAKGAYLQLARIHHPDRGGKEKAFKEVSAAWEQINPDEFPISFDDALNEYLRPRAEALSKLQTKLAETQDRLHGYKELMLRYWRASADTVRYDTSSEMKIPVLVVPAPSLNLVELLVTSIMEQLIVDKVKLDQRPRGNRFHRSNDMPPRLGMRIEDTARMVTVNQFGELVLQRCEIVRFDARKDFPPGLIEGWNYIPPLAKHGSHGWRPVGEPYILRGARVIGVIDSSLRNRASVDGKIRRLLPSPNGDSQEFMKTITEGFSAEDFAEFLPLIDPYLCRAGTVIATQMVNGSLRFLVLGKLTKVRRKGDAAPESAELSS